MIFFAHDLLPFSLSLITRECRHPPHSASVTRRRYGGSSTAMQCKTPLRTCLNSHRVCSAIFHPVIALFFKLHITRHQTVALAPSAEHRPQVHPADPQPPRIRADAGDHMPLLTTQIPLLSFCFHFILIPFFVTRCRNSSDHTLN